MASIGGSVYSVSVNGVVSLVHAGDAGSVWDFEQMQDSTGADYIWFTNRVNSAFKWDGINPATQWMNLPNGSMVRVWKNRMCISGVSSFPQRLFFSDIGNPEAPTGGYGNNWIDFRTSDDDLDPITWLEVLDEDLIVFKKRSVWQVFNSATFENRRIGSPGCEGQFQSCELEGRVYYWSRIGMYSTDGISVRFEGENVEPWIQSKLNFAAIDKVRLCAARDRRVFAAVPAEGSFENNYVLEMIPHMRRQRGDGRTTSPWMVHDYKASSLCTFRPNDVDGLFAGASDTNKIHQLFIGSTDDGNTISSFWFGA